ncbi:hypothetical protein [Xanthovirga aplysinae]|uniref:hypothetical protein n=1 Tax=Xanthovirga aplysinae TaxID=2529853 RepID=UPI0012BB95F2|nr:hypothetical protein [Xanthovirga aplysinae]
MNDLLSELSQREIIVQINNFYQLIDISYQFCFFKKKNWGGWWNRIEGSVREL